jgi:hypothetical protein
MATNKDWVLRAAVSTCTINSVDVGYTKEPYIMTVTTERDDVFVEQDFSPIKRPITARRITGAISFAEASLANMALAFGMPSGNISGSSLTLDNDELGEVTCVIVGKTGSAFNAGSDIRTLSFPQTVVGDGDTPYNVAKLVDTAMAVGLSHLPNSSQVYGTIVDS